MSKIKLSSKPWCPEGFTIKSNKVIKSFAPDRVELFWAKGQKEGLIKGEELLTKQPKGVLNSNVLKWYLENPDRIPKEWEKYSGIYFWGTILRYPFGCRRVLCLDFDGGEWDWDYNWLVGDWDRGNPSASLASAKNLPGKTKGSVPPPPRLFARGEFYT